QFSDHIRERSELCKPSHDSLLHSNMLRPSTFLLACAITILSFTTTAAQGVKSKLCANDQCSDPLFTSTIVKVQPYPELLEVGMGQTVEVLSIKFSDRPDIIEARANGVTGKLYRSSLQLEDYVNFLKFSVIGKKEYLSVAQEAKVGTKAAVLGSFKAESDLIRDYNINAQTLANEKGVTPELMDIPAAPQKGHGHSHSGHGHSHGGHSHDHLGHSHDHSDAGHGHSHDAPATPPKVEVVPETPKMEEVKVDAVPVAPKTEEVKQEAPQTVPVPVVEEAAPASEEKKLTTPDDMEAALQAMIEADMQKMAAEMKEEDPVDASAAAAAAAAPPPVEERAVPVVATPAAEVPVAEVPPTTTPTPVAPPVVEEQPVTTPPPPVEIPPVPTPIDNLPPLPVTTVAPPPLDTAAETPQVVAEDKMYCYGKDECPPGSIPPPSTASDDTRAPVHTEIPSDPIPPPSSDIPSDPLPIPPRDDDSSPPPIPPRWDDSPPPPIPAGDRLPPTAYECASYKSSILASTLRNTLPAVFGETTDGSIGLWLIISFIIGSLVIVLLSKTCEGGDSLAYDRSAAHNLATALKACQAELASVPRGIDPNIQQRADQMVHEIRQLEARLQHTQKDLNEKTAEAEEAVRKTEACKEVIANAEMRASSAEEEWKKKSEEVMQLMGRIEKSRNEMEIANEELRKERNRHEGMEAEMSRLRQKMEEMEREMEEGEKRERELNGEKKRMESEVAQMATLMDEMEKAAVERSEKNGEKTNGWDDDDWSKEETEKQTGEGSSANGSWSHGEEEETERTLPTAQESTPSGGNANIREMVSLRAKATTLEQENAKLQKLIDYEKKERSRLEEERSSLTIEMGQLKKELIEKETERRNANTQLTDSYNKNMEMIQNVQTRHDRMSEEVMRLQNELKTVEEDKRKTEDRLKEVDGELKRLRNEHLKLETRHFNQMIDMKKQIQLAHQQPSMPNPLNSSDVLNMTSNSSLDDRGSLPMDSHSSLWDEPDETEIQTAVHSTRRTPSSELLGSSHSRRSIRSRRSDQRFLVDSGSPLDSGSGGEQQRMMGGGGGGMERGGPVRVDPQRRMRSRSHGRVPTQRNSGYGSQAPPMPHYMDYQQPMYGLDEMARRHSRSGQQLYYSSGGSNGARSPPPPIAAVPPIGVRRPSSKRATGGAPPQ
ncbi:hypothetical protein PFISCL1PPCAC_24333, partial [Pristionchus fissidentatus]